MNFIFPSNLDIKLLFQKNTQNLDIVATASKQTSHHLLVVLCLNKPFCVLLTQTSTSTMEQKNAYKHIAQKDAIKTCYNNKQIIPKNSCKSVVTWPRNPVVPLSTRGTPAAKHRRFTCRLASKLSSPFKTTLNCLKKSRSNSGSLTFA